MVFMMGPQFRLTGPSLRGMSTELHAGFSGVFKPRGRHTHSNQFFTSSSCELGMEFMWSGAFVKSLKMSTMSNCFSPNWTRSSDAISMSERVTTRKGGSDKCTRHSVVGCKRTFVRNGTPSNDSSRNGISGSSVSPVCVKLKVSKRTGRLKRG